MDKAQVTSPIPSSSARNQASSTSLNSSAISSANVTVNKQLQANIQLTNHTTQLQAQLTMKQAAAFSSGNQGASSLQNALALHSQQHVLLFLQSQLVKSNIGLSPALAKQVSVWLTLLKQQTAIDGKAHSGTASKTAMPEQLATLLASQLGITKEDAKQRIKSATLKLNHFEFSFLQGEPIVQIKTAKQRNTLPSEQLLQTLQFLIPLGLGQESSLLVKGDSNGSSPETGDTESDKNRFELTFNLDELGQLLIKVTLENFQLTTQCIYSNLALEQKVKHFWPKLTSRLDKLGFDIDSKFQLKPELELQTSQERHTGLVNTKV